MRTSMTRFTALALAVLSNAVGQEGSDLGGTPPAPVAPKSKRDLLVEKANAFAEKYNDCLAQIKALDDKAADEARLANVNQGDRVDATVGKGDKAVQLLNALVLGVQDVEGKGKQVKVQVGAGFDTQTYVLNAGQIVNIITAEELEAAVSNDEAGEQAEQTAE